MRPTDYETLAATYDAPWRTNVPPDSMLGERLKASSANPYRVLDVGCGTGAWLLSQTKAYAGTPPLFMGSSRRRPCWPSPGARTSRPTYARLARIREATAADPDAKYTDEMFGFTMVATKPG